MGIFEVVTDEQKVDLQRAYESIQQFDLLRQNIGQEVTYTTLDVHGELCQKEGKLREVFDFISIGINDENIKLFPKSFLPILLEVSRKEDGAPLFSLSCSPREIVRMREEQIDKYTKLGKIAKGSDYYDPFLELTKFMALSTYGGIIPGLKSGNFDILERAYQYSTKTRGDLIRFGIDPERISGSIGRNLVYIPSRKEVRKQLADLRIIAESIRRGFPEEKYAFGYGYPFENTESGRKEFLLNADKEKQSFDAILTLRDEIVGEFTKSQDVK